MIRSAISSALSLCVVSSVAGAAVPTHADLSYGDTFNQDIDIYLPGGAGPFPLVMYIHGGAWLSGDKTQVEPFADALLARGLAVASINHRMTYQATYPSQLHDCKGAVRWLRAHAAQYNLDPTRIATFGDSTGGHLSALMATTSGDPSQEGNVGGNTGFSSAVIAAVDAYGPTNLFSFAQNSGGAANVVSLLIDHDIHDIIDHQNDASHAALVALVQSANPITHVNAGDPPMYVFHGMDDPSVPYQQSQALVNALNVAGITNTLRLLPGGIHDVPPAELPAICDFLAAHLGGSGGPTPPPPPQDLVIGGARQNDAFGQSIAVIGDVNADGVDDVLVGAPLNDNAGGDAGMVSIHSGVNGATLRTLTGRKSGDQFGFAVAAAGDVNADGIPDFIVGSPFSDLGATDAGRVEVFSGATGLRLRGINGLKAGDQLGYAVAGVDVDGDGVRDIAAGAPYANSPAADSGAVTLYTISTGVVLQRIKGSVANDHLGFAVASAGDVNGDAREDVLIGVPHSDTNGSNSGSIHVVGFDGSAWITRFTQAGAAGDQFGSALAGIGDANGDALSDILIGAPSARNTANVACGVARLYSVATAALIAEFQPTNGQNGEQFGAAVTGLGDIDGDLLADVAVGAWKHNSIGANTGRVALFGGLGALAQMREGPAQGARFGRAIAGAGDLDADGLPDIVVGASGMFWDGTRRGVVYSYGP